MSPAVYPLFAALSSYTLLTCLHLTNIAFPHPIVTPDVQWKGIPYIPSLRSLYLGQATFLPAEEVAEFMLRCMIHSTNNSSSPERVQLVDVYEESIWGSRLKMPGLLAASTKLDMKDQYMGSPLLNFVEKLVFVDAKTERIMGGDRVVPELITEPVLNSS